MRIEASWARVVVTIFTVAVFYGSACSTTCAIGICPSQVQQAASHDCDQTSSHHSDQSGHHSPDNPDCSQHQHPGLFVTKSGNISEFHLSVVDHLSASAAAFSLVHGLPAIFARPEASEHAPPIVSSVPLYEQTSVLRI